MSQEQWLKAAEGFKKKKSEEARQIAEATQAAKTTVIQKEQEISRVLNQYLADIQTATEELSRFISSDEGLAAQKLLSSSGYHIIIAEEIQGGGMGVVYFLDSNGLQLSIESTGTWIVYAGKVPEPRISPATAEEAAKLAIRLGAKPLEIVEKIRQRLNQIAEEVL